MGENKIPSQKTNEKTNDGETGGSLNYSRREAVMALAKYSAAVGSAAMVVVTAEGLVSEASAYGYKENGNKKNGYKNKKNGYKKKKKYRARRRMRRVRRRRRMRQQRRRRMRRGRA